jgi:hypothetical protein
MTYEDAIARLECLMAIALGSCTPGSSRTLDAAGVVSALQPIIEALRLVDVEIDGTETSE